MVQITKAEKKQVYRYILQEGVIVLHKDFSSQPHKGTGVLNIHLRKIMRSLKDRGYVELVFSWQHFYYFINNEGKKYLSDYLNLTEEVVPLTWKYNFFHLERTKRDSMSTSLRTEAEKSEERTEDKADLKEEREKEVEVQLEETEVKRKKKQLTNQLKPLNQPNDQL